MANVSFCKQNDEILVRFSDNRSARCMVPCIDLTIFDWFPSYSRFSYIVNGLLTVGIVAFGCLGNSLMFWSIRHKRNQKRLCWHLRMLCFWDTVLLLSIFLFTGLPCLYQDVLTLYGFTGVLLQLFHPLGSIATTASVWEILAITGERYWAVIHPLKPLRSAGTSIKCFCTAIGIGAIAINILSFFESGMVDCFHQKQHRIFTQLATNFLSDSTAYHWLCRLIPDFIFRCPIPFVAITLLTVGTLIGRKREHVIKSSDSFRHMNERRGLSTPFVLTVLNTKFILCNSLYVIYNVLKMVGWANNFKVFFFLADISNFLVSIQSATNWLLFLQWRRPITNSDFKQRKDSAQVFTYSELHRLKSMWARNERNKGKISAQLVQIFVAYNHDVVHSLFEEENINSNSLLLAEELTYERINVRACEFLDQFMAQLTSAPPQMARARESLRMFGQQLYERGLRISPQCWTRAKSLLVKTLAGSRGWQEEVVATKLCSFMIREIKHGSLCQKLDMKKISVSNGEMWS